MALVLNRGERQIGEEQSVWAIAFGDSCHSWRPSDVRGTACTAPSQAEGTSARDLCCLPFGMHGKGSVGLRAGSAGD